MRAYVLIDINPGKETECLQHLSNIEGITYADVVHGATDIVAMIEGDDEIIDKSIMRIRRLQFVKKTQSLLSFQPNIFDELSYELSTGSLAKKRVQET